MEKSRLFKSERTIATGSLVASLVLVGLLFFVWPIPRTISLRDVLLVVCLGLFARLACQNRHESFPWQSLRIPFSLYITLSVWIVFVALVISDETAWALGEIKGQWLKATIAVVVGGLLGVVIRHTRGMLNLTLIVIGSVLLFHVLYVDYEAMRIWFGATGVWYREYIPRLAGLTEGPDKSNYLTNMLLYMLFAEIFMRVVYRKRFLPIGNVLLAVIVGLALFSVYVEAVRNGIAELAVVFGLVLTLIAKTGDRIRRVTALGAGFTIVAVMLILGSLNLNKDDRWQTFIETVPIALDIENRGWVDQNLPQPKLANGETVDWSNYSRIARIRAGLSLMMDHPLGVGFGRNSFGHAVEQKYGLRTSHSHSGIIDLGVGAGLPGVLLWLVFLGALWRLGYRGIRESHGIPALVLLFLTTGYGFRMLVDSTIRDHMLQMFLFFAAFLAVATANKLDGRTAPPA